MASMSEAQLGLWTDHSRRYFDRKFNSDFKPAQTGEADTNLPRVAGPSHRLLGSMHDGTLLQYVLH